MKPEKERKKKRWIRPAWLNRMQLDKRTKIVGLFVLVMAGILFFLHQYNMRYVRNLDYAGTTVTDREVFAQLKQGTAEIGSAVWLPHFASNEPLYRRGSHYYIGEDHVRIQDGAPILINDGTYVNLIDGEGSLINEEWERQPAMAGMYISNGKSFNYDGTAADEEEILFLHMSNGLYLNTKSLDIYGLLQDVKLPVNSFFYIDEEGIRYYARQDGELMLYGSFTQVYEAMVEIDGQRMTYEDFLIKLGIFPAQEFERQPEETETEAVSEPETETPEYKDDHTTEAELSLEDLMESQEEDGDNSQKEQMAPEAGNGQSVGDDTSSQPGEGNFPGQGDGFGEQPDQMENGGTYGDEIPDRLPDRYKDRNHGDNWNGNNGNGSQESNGNGGSGTGESGSTGAGENGSTEAGESGSTGTGESGSAGTGESGSTGAGESGSTGTGESGSTGAGESGSTGAGESGSGSETGGVETKPAESLPVATGNNTEKPSLPIATDNNAGKPGEGGDNQGGSGDGGNGDSPSYDIEWERPKVSISDLEADVYSCVGKLNIEDSSNCFSKVILSFGWNDNLSILDPTIETAVRYRKVLSGEGVFQIDNLPPDTKIFVAASLQYYDANGKKIRETEPFQTMVIKTKPFSDVDRICISFSDNIAHSSEGKYYENQAEVFDLQISAANGYLLDKVNRGELKLYPVGNRDEAITFRLYSSTLKRCMTLSQDYRTSTSQGRLEPNTEYRYEIALWDAFGNSFTESNKVCWGTADKKSEAGYYKATGYDVAGNLYRPRLGDAWKTSGVLGSERFWGYTHTSKTIPKVLIEQTPLENPDALSKAQLSVRMEDIHQALIEGNGSSSGITGTMPKDKKGRGYKVYFALYSEKTGFGKGNEVPIVQKGDGTIAIDESGSSFCYVRDSMLPGSAGDSYLIDGLTSGETYLLRVFGSYNLNDNKGNVYDEELGSIRFGTTLISAYGRVYYTFTNRNILTQPLNQGIPTYDHEKYESATAQEISVTINTKRTNPLLARDYYDHFYLELKERKTNESLLRLNFSKRETQQLLGLHQTELTVTESQIVDGYYTYTLRGVNANTLGNSKGDYSYEILGGDLKEKQMPLIEMKIPVKQLPESVCEMLHEGDETSYRFKLWDAFLALTEEEGVPAFSTARTELFITFGEMSLTSFKDYTIVSESFASQGSEDSHNVTSLASSYYQRRFSTLKEMPFVTIGGVLQVGRYLYLVDVDFHDEDNSIEGKKIRVRNVNISRNNTASTKEELLDYAPKDSGGRIAKVSFDSLIMNSDYRLELVPEDIRRTGKTTEPRYQNQVLDIYEYTAGKGVTGNLFMVGISHPLQGLTENKNGKDIYHTAAEYNKYEIGNFQYGIMKKTEEGTIEVADRSRSNQVMDPISVRPGQIYYLNRLHRDGGNVSAAFMDADQKLIRTTRTVQSNGYIKIPEGAAYMRLSMYGDLISYQSQVILVYDEEDSALNKLQMVSAPKELEADGKTFVFKEEDLAEGDTIALVSGEWAGSGNGSISVTLPDGTSEAHYSGYTVQYNKETKTYTLKVTTSLTDSSGSSVAPDVRIVNSEKIKVFSQYYYNELIADYRVEIRDYKGSAGSLQDVKSGGVQVIAYAFDKEGNPVDPPQEAGLRDHADQNGLYQKSKSFQTKTGFSYRLSLQIEWRGEWYPLDEQEFTATESEYSIATGNQMMKLAAWRFGKFRVIADLGEIDPFTIQNLKDTVGAFGGSINGQGHSMTVNMPSNAYASFMSIGDNGILENLELTVNMGNGKNLMEYCYPFGSNYGEIRNIVVYLDTGIGNFSHTRCAGLCAENSGVIENFALYYKYGENTSQGSYMGSIFGGLVMRNRGTIRNGVAYGSRAVDVTTGVYGGTTEFSVNYAGGVVGQNFSTGTVEQVLSILNMRVEANSSSAIFSSHGLIVGSNSGVVKNCFTSGEMYRRYWEDRGSDNKIQMGIRPGNTNIAWPGCNSGSAPAVKNCYYFTSGQYNVSNQNVKHLSGRSALKSPQFYGDTINREGGFVVESQLASEFYPIVNMPICMDGRQQNIPLNSTMPGSIPTYISSSLVRSDNKDMVYLEDDKLSSETVSQIKAMINNDSLLEEFLEINKEDGTANVKKQFALIDAVFNNRSQSIIKNLKFEGLTVEYLSSQDSEGLTTVKNLVSPYIKTAGGEWVLSGNPDAFSASHVVQSFEYGYTADALTQVDVVNETTSVDFYYPLSYETWSAQIPRKTTTNYLLREDICFAAGDGKFANTSAVQSALNSFNNATSLAMGGIFDGRGHKLDFGQTVIGMYQNPYFFREIGAGGEVKNLDVENLTLSGSRGEGSHVGFIRMAQGRSILTDIHMRNTKLEDVQQYAGSLAACVDSNKIINCTVAGTEITSGSTALKLRAGGMVGDRVSQSLIRNSFVRGLVMNTTQGYSVECVGGMVGSDRSTGSDPVLMPNIVSCYAEGTIQTGFPNAGGLVGKGVTRTVNTWCAVDVVGTKYVGSISGYASEDNTDWQHNSYSAVVASGELYASSESLERRMVGYWQRPSSSELKTRVYAYKGQLLNGSDSESTADVTALTDKDTMQNQQFWSETVVIGKYFHLTGVEDPDPEKKIYSVTDEPVYPILYKDDGVTLLPDQTNIYYEIYRPEFRVVSAVAEDKGITPKDLYGEYELTFTVEVEGTVSPEDLEGKITADGLKFDQAEYSCTPGTSAEGKDITTVVITKAEADKRLDSYRLSYQYDKDGRTVNVNTKLAFKNEKGEETPLYWQLDSYDKWKQKVIDDGRGYAYENFLICKDIDLQSANDIQLKINRLQGKIKNPGFETGYDYRSKAWVNTPEFYRLYNLNLRNKDGAWITEIANYMGYLEFENCNITTGSAFSNLGLIGLVNGDVEYVDFKNNTITAANASSGSYSNVGCIGQVQGKIYRSRNCDTRVELGPGAGFRYSLVGGTVGYVRELEETAAFGTAYNASKHDSSNSYWISLANDKSSGVNYFGGIAGYVHVNSQNIYGEKLDIYGGSNTGTLAGYSYVSTREDGKAIKDYPNVEVQSCRVTGYNYVGGAIGRARTMNYIRVMGTVVEANGSNAGGVSGENGHHGISNGEVYKCEITSALNGAGGICGGTAGVSTSKVANSKITAKGSYVGGITARGSANTCAVYNLEKLSGASYIGGIVGANSNWGSILRNVVSQVKVEGEGAYIGGIAGSISGAEAYANEVKQDVVVDGKSNCGGLAGYSSGGTLHHNIIGGTVSGGNYVGGLLGEILGFGYYRPGYYMPNRAAKVYGNLIVCESISADSSYAAGLIAGYTAGEQPVDGNGDPITDIGYISYMSSANFYGNAILAESITLRSGAASIDFYANYKGNANLKYLGRLDREGGKPRYDCTLPATMWSNVGVLGVPTMKSIGEVGNKLQPDAVVSVTGDILRNSSFYANAFANANPVLAGGMGFGTGDFDYSDLTLIPANKACYPYVRRSSGGNLAAYQKKESASTNSWNSYYIQSGNVWVTKPYDGSEGIPIVEIAATTRNLRSVARGMVYPSGPDTINIDFSRIDNSLVNFDIEGRDGYLEKTAIDAVKDKAGVCSMIYDYQTDFVLNLYSLDGSVKETYVYYADNLRRTVMSWNGKNYYILSDGIYQGMEDGTSKKVLDGEFVNLYQGAVLDSEGKVHELAPSPAPARVKKKAAEEELDEILSSAEADEESEELLSSAEAEEISEEHLPSAEAEEVSNELLSSDKQEEEPDQLLPFHESEKDNEQEEENDAWSGPDSQSE